MHTPFPEVGGQTERVARYRLPPRVCKKDPCFGESGEAGAHSQRRGRGSNSVLQGHGREAGEQNRDASGQPPPPKSQAGCGALCSQWPWHRLSTPSTSGSATRPPGCRELSALLPLAGVRSLPEPCVSPGSPAGTHFTQSPSDTRSPKGLGKLCLLVLTGLRELNSIALGLRAPVWLVKAYHSFPYSPAPTQNWT